MKREPTRKDSKSSFDQPKSPKAFSRLKPPLPGRPGSPGGFFIIVARELDVCFALLVAGSSKSLSRSVSADMESESESIAGPGVVARGVVARGDGYLRGVTALPFPESLAEGLIVTFLPVTDREGLDVVDGRTM